MATIVLLSQVSTRYIFLEPDDDDDDPSTLAFAWQLLMSGDVVES